MRAALRDNGLSIAFGTIFLLAVGLQAISGHDAFNHEQALHHGDPISMWHYVTSSVFWADVMENWQSEFLAVGSMVILSVYLRQRGSPESKPVGAPHGETAAEG